jgi:hypothetical protein
MNPTGVTYPVSDLELARRIERTEARANAAFVEARAELQPSSGGTWVEVAGAYAMFDGVGSPLTQSFGLGVFEEVGSAEVQAIEEFFRERGAEVFHEISPLADSSLWALLGERGYRPLEFSSVLFRPIAAELRLDRPRSDHIRVRRIELEEANHWAEVAAQGWGESPELAAFMRDLGQISARSRGNHSFLAELQGQPIAAASLSLGEGMALLAGASTVPRARNQGAQLAVLEARLRFAADHGCDLAMMAAAPGSASQRNAERQGFRIAYTRVKWQLHSGSS